MYVDGVDDAGAVDGLEDEGEDDEEGDDEDVDRLAAALGGEAGGGLALDVEQVDADGCGESGEGGVDAGEGGGGDAEDEEHGDGHAEPALLHEHGEEGVALGGHGDALPVGEGVEQHAEDEEEQVDGDEADAVGAHVLLRLADVFTGEILLHHVLVEPCHDDGYEDTAEELFPEVLF